MEYNRNPNYRSEIHECLRFPMRMCRWAGFFPVEGLEKPTNSGIRYNLKGIYSIYYAATVLTGCLSAILIIIWLVKNDLSLTLISDFLFTATGFFSMIMLSRLARQWPVFMSKVTEIEHQLQEIRISKKTSKYCNTMVVVVMLSALVEHILSVIYGIYETKLCQTTTDELGELVEVFLTNNAPYYLRHERYSHISGFVFKIVNIQVTFLWSFTDVLTICFSIYLASYFQDLNIIINNRQNIPWERLRTHYSRVVELVNEVDARLSVVILQSFITYIFYICLQLFHTIKTTQSRLISCNDDIIDKIRGSLLYLSYYVFSFLFMVLRFVITSLSAANVNLVAKKPLIALNAVSSSEYSLEVRRFRMQIEYTPVAMSGLFFYVTRPMLLQVVGSIITYELVMLQLH